MIRYFLVIFSVLLSTPSFAGSPVIFSGDSVKALKQNFDLNGNVSILSGSVNPTSSATSAPKGSLYLSTSTGKAYRKNDAGSSTNWFDLQNGITALTSDVSASGSGSVTATVNSVGGSTASAVNTATILSNAATNSNTNGAIVKRDGSGNFSATTITANLTGNASGTAASFTGSLTGDVTSTAMATTIGANKVTNSMMSTVSTQTFKGRTSGSTGNVEDLTATQATAILNTMVGDSGSGGTKGLVGAPASGDAAAGKFWKADGTWATPTAGFSNPMTTGGDIIYGGASGVATRLANGSSGQVLTSAGGTSAPTWASIFSSWSGHFESNSSWTRTNTSLGLPAIDSSATLTQEVNVNFNSVTAHNDGTPGNNYPGIVINPPSGTYEILVTIMIASGTSLAEARAGLTVDGGSTYLDLKLVRMNTGGSTLYTVVTLVGHVTFSGASKNIDIYLASSSGACLIDPSTAGLNPYPIKWSIKRVG